MTHKQRLLARTHTRRLLQLANILEKFRPVNGKRFNMGVWGTHALDHHPEETDNFCGTAACALGHAAMDKGFRQAGLRMEWRLMQAYKGIHGSVPAQYHATICFEECTDEQAGAAFFGLDDEEAGDVFLYTSRTKSEVVKVLRAYAKNRVELRGEE